MNGLELPRMKCAARDAGSTRQGDTGHPSSHGDARGSGSPAVERWRRIRPNRRAAPRDAPQAGTFLRSLASDAESLSWTGVMRYRENDLGGGPVQDRSAMGSSATGKTRETTDNRRPLGANTPARNQGWKAMSFLRLGRYRPTSGGIGRHRAAWAVPSREHQLRWTEEAVATDGRQLT